MPRIVAASDAGSGVIEPWNRGGAVVFGFGRGLGSVRDLCALKGVDLGWTRCAIGAFTEHAARATTSRASAAMVRDLIDSREYEQNVRPADSGNAVT